TIAEELDMREEADGLVGTARRKLPKVIKLRARRAAALGGGAGKSRKTTKNADHQTNPRFEQLVDLGFLTKPVPPDGDEAEKLTARKRWQYVPTDVCRRWAAALRERQHRDAPFLWHSFGAASIRAFQIAPSVDRPATRSTLVARYVWKSYEH